MTTRTGELFGRAQELIVGDLDVSEFDIRFRVEKTLKQEPNKCMIEVYNLSAEHRARIAEYASGKRSKHKKKGKTATPALSSIPVKLSVGYGTDIDQIFLGDLGQIKVELSDADSTTTISTADGEKAIKSSRCNLSFGPKTALDIVVKAVLNTLGLGLGNYQQIVKKLQNGSAVLPRGIVCSGPSAKVLTDLCRSADIEWSIQDGVPTFINLNEALADKAVLLNAETGLIGSPSVDADGKLTAKTLIIPKLRCGRICVIDSKAVKGNYRIDKLVYDGETSGDSWYANIEGTRY